MIGVSSHHRLAGTIGPWIDPSPCAAIATTIGRWADKRLEAVPEVRPKRRAVPISLVFTRLQA